MKHLPKVLVLASALVFPTLASAQNYDKAHKIQASEFSNVTIPNFARNQNMNRAQVTALQLLLRNRGFYSAKIDGKFGFQTEKAVRAFQRAKHLKVDGLVGAQTWPVLLLRLKQGDRGDAVRAVQTLLRAKITEDGPAYPDLKIDGIYGAATADDVRDFQRVFGYYFKENGLKPDGIVGAQTWGVLLSTGFSD